MAELRQFRYNPDGHLQPGQLAYLPIELAYSMHRIQVDALLDSGASVNVLPYGMGLQLGADWDNLGRELQLSGNLAAAPAKGIQLDAKVASFPPVQLVFAWSRLDNIPLILGQMNFFQIFEVNFVGAEQTFELSLYTKL